MLSFSTQYKWKKQQQQPCPYLQSKLTEFRNKLKQSKTTKNDLKRSKTTSNHLK